LVVKVFDSRTSLTQISARHPLTRFLYVAIAASVWRNDGVNLA
jgi:hypothetical protein